MRKHLLERHNLLFGQVSAIIDQYVETWNFVPDLLPESAVDLVADEDSGSVVLECFAGFAYIDSVHPALRAEIFPPHFETPAAIDAYLQDMNLFSNELLKVAMIDVEVVNPFPDSSSLRVGVEEFLQRIGRIVHTYSSCRALQRCPRHTVLSPADHRRKFPHQFTSEPWIM